LDEQTFTSLIPALKWMVSIIETYCLREIFYPILSSTRITSHFSRTEPQRIGLNKLSNSWKSRRQTSFHQICGYPTPPISTLWRTLWTQDVTFIIYDILYPNFKTQLSEILLFCSVNTGCFVEYNACYVLHIITAIILRHTKNIYEICNCKPHRPKAHFLTNTVM